MTAGDRTPRAPFWYAPAVIAAAIALAPRPGAAAPGRWFANLEGSFSFLGQLVSGEAAIGSFAYRVAGGFRPSAGLHRSSAPAGRPAGLEVVSGRDAEWSPAFGVPSEIGRRV